MKGGNREFECYEKQIDLVRREREQL